jgi:hypothetical protein
MYRIYRSYLFLGPIALDDIAEWLHLKYICVGATHNIGYRFARERSHNIIVLNVIQWLVHRRTLLTIICPVMGSHSWGDEWTHLCNFLWGRDSIILARMRDYMVCIFKLDDRRSEGYSASWEVLLIECSILVILNIIVFLVFAHRHWRIFNSPLNDLPCEFGLFFGILSTLRNRLSRLPK